MAHSRRPPGAGGLATYKPMMLAVAPSLAVVTFLVLIVIPGRGQDIDARRPDATAITAPELAIDADEAPPNPANLESSDHQIFRIDEPLILEIVSSSTPTTETEPTAVETATRAAASVEFQSTPRRVQTPILATATMAGFSSQPTEVPEIRAVATSTSPPPQRAPTPTPPPAATDSSPSTATPGRMDSPTAEPHTATPPAEPTLQPSPTQSPTSAPSPTPRVELPPSSATATASVLASATPSGTSSPAPIPSQTPDLTASAEPTGTAGPTSTESSDATATRTPRSRDRSSTLTPPPTSEATRTPTPTEADTD